MSETMPSIEETESSRERTAIVIGRLKDLGLGNPDGIPSRLANASDQELQAVAEADNERLVMPTDLSCTACIDGRLRLGNADGSPALVRLRRVGGSASNLGVALNANASIIETIDPEAPLGVFTMTLDEHIGYSSAHLGGCGGANGEVADNRAISQDPAILNAARALLSIREVSDYFEIPSLLQTLPDSVYDELFEKVRENAGQTAERLERMGWDGQDYVKSVVETRPQNVEALDVDESDHLFHGHKEPKLTIIVGDKTMPHDDDGFVWNLKATKEVCEKLAGQRGAEGYLQAVIAEVAKHMAVAKRLPSVDTPVILQVA